MRYHACAMASNERTYVVSGMSCRHCVSSVEEEVAAVPGVSVVAVDLASGRLTVVGDRVRDEEIRAAVAEAGYGLVE
jgi:copper chaperone